MKNQEIDNAVTILCKNLDKSFTLTNIGKSKISIDGVSYTEVKFQTYIKKSWNDFTMSIPNEIPILLTGVKEIMDKFNLPNAQEAQSVLASKVFKRIVDVKSKSKSEKLTGVKSDDMQNSVSFSYRGYIPIQDVYSLQTVFFNTNDDSINTSLDYKAYERYCRTRPQEEKEDMLRLLTAGRIVFEPENPKSVFMRDVDHQKDVKHFNAHKFPKWRMEEIENPKLPNEFKKFYKYLFPIEEDRNYVSNWIYNMLIMKNEIILFLHGNQGIGKSTFVNILSKLVGRANYVQTKSDFFESRFNDELQYKRLAFHDESVVTYDNVNNVKTITNPDITIEGKGKDRMIIDNHCSHIIANNPNQKNYIRPQDRRFSVPKLATNNMELEFGTEFLDELHRLIEEDESFISNIGWYFIKNGNYGFSRNKRLFNTTFIEFVHDCLSGWELNLIEYIKNEGEEAKLSDLSHIIKDTSVSKVSKFLTDMKDLDGEEYGYVTRKSDGYTLIPNKKYNKTEEEEDDFISKFELTEAEKEEW